MLQRPVGCAAARIVDQDHGGDRGAAEDIKRHQPTGSSSGLENWPYDLWTCAGYAGHVTGFYRVTGAYELFPVEHSLASDIASSNCGRAALSGNGHCNPHGDKSSLICSAGAGAVGSKPATPNQRDAKPQRFETPRHDGPPALAKTGLERGTQMRLSKVNWQRTAPPASTRSSDARHCAAIAQAFKL